MDNKQYRTNCNKCNTRLTWATHEKYKPRMEKRAFMFTDFQRCEHCHRIFVYEEFKIHTQEMIKRLKIKEEEEKNKDNLTLF